MWTTGTTRKSDCHAAAMAAVGESASATSVSACGGACGGGGAGAAAGRATQRAQVPREDIGPRGDQRFVQIEGGQEDLGPARGVLLVSPRGGGFAPLDQ